MTTSADSRPLKLLVMEDDGPEITAASLRVLEAVDRKLGLNLLFETVLPAGRARTAIWAIRSAPQHSRPLS
jgi:hypothetical protein